MISDKYEMSPHNPESSSRMYERPIFSLENPFRELVHNMTLQCTLR